MGPLDFPLAAVEGREEVKLALSLLVVDPALKGILIRGGRGSGKTLLARGLRGLLVRAGAPFVEVPTSVAEDRLLGGLDWSATLAAGERRLFEGLLLQANGGVLFVDHVNLRPLASIAQMVAALNSGVVRLERDGLSLESPTSFALLGSYDPDDGEPPPILRDAVGLHVEIGGGDSLEGCVEIVERALAFRSNPADFAERYATDAARSEERLHAARRLLPAVTIGSDVVRRLCEIELQLGVEGHRAAIFAVRVARAHAAWCGRKEVAETDLRAAVRLALEPRARSSTAENARRSCAGTASPGRDRRAASPAGASTQIEAPAVDNPAPSLEPPARRGGPSSGRGRAPQGPESNSRRGRYVRALEVDPGHGVVALDATLRAAAPLQRIRQASGRKVAITGGDLRFKQFRRKTGIQIVFALDASGSMAANRIQQAKGAILRLLREAYVHRDLVALVGFRGDRAEVLMKAGRSVELARRALDELPAGGGTPLASGILTALELARGSVRPTLLVLMTDGRANVSLTGEPVWTELERASGAVRDSEAVPIVIDTSRGLTASAGAERLASMLQARYVTLPRMQETGVYESVAEAAATMR